MDIPFIFCFGFQSIYAELEDVYYSQLPALLLGAVTLPT